MYIRHVPILTNYIHIEHHDFLVMSCMTYLHHKKNEMMLNVNQIVFDSMFRHHPKIFHLDHRSMCSLSIEDSLYKCLSIILDVLIIVAVYSTLVDIFFSRLAPAQMEFETKTSNICKCEHVKKKHRC